MKLRETILQHLHSHQEITYIEVVQYAKECNQKIITGNRFLQSDKAAGRKWEWYIFDQSGKLLKPKQAWFKKRLKKPLKETTVFKK